MTPVGAVAAQVAQSQSPLSESELEPQPQADVKMEGPDPIFGDLANQVYLADNLGFPNVAVANVLDETDQDLFKAYDILSDEYRDHLNEEKYRPAVAWINHNRPPL